MVVGGPDVGGIGVDVFVLLVVEIGGGGTLLSVAFSAPSAELLLPIATPFLLAACFFLTSIGLAILAGAGSKQSSIVDEVLNSTSELPVPASPQVPTGQ